MFKNIVFTFICLAFLGACDFGNQTNLATSPLESGKIFLAEGNKLRAEGETRAAKKSYTKAIIELEKAAKVNASQKGLASLLGQSQYRIRDFDNAIQWLNKAIKQDKEDVKSVQYLGYCLVNKSKMIEAEASFKKAFSIDKSGAIKKESIAELTEIGELSLSLGANFASQGNPAQGVQFKKLGMRILAMALDYSDYDMDFAKKIQIYATDMQDQILMDWIANIIANDGQRTITIDVPQ